MIRRGRGIDWCCCCIPRAHHALPDPSAISIQHKSAELMLSRKDFFFFPGKKSFVISVRLLIREKDKAKVKLLGFRILSSGK
jgi:hypothetical protein